MLSILNKLTLQKKLQNFVTNNVFLDKKVNNNKHKNPCRSRELISDPLAPKADVLPRTTKSTESIDCSQAI